MIIDQTVLIGAPIDDVWDFVMDVPSVARCMPGVAAVQQLDADNYVGSLKAGVGPITVTFAGKLHVAWRDSAARQAQLNAQGDDRRSGSVTATLVMSLFRRESQATELHLHTDAAVFGKIGEFGQAVIRKSVERTLRQFAANVTQALESRTEPYLPS